MLENLPKAKLHNIKSIDDRIKFIKQQIYKSLIDPEQKIRQLTAEVIAPCETKDYECYIAEIFFFVKGNVKYVRDYEGLDTYQTAYRTLQWGMADCDDFSILLASMLMSIGIPVKLRIIKTIKDTDWSHIYILAGLPPQKPKHWIPLDASVKESYVGWEAPKHIIKEKKDFRVEFFKE